MQIMTVYLIRLAPRSYELVSEIQRRPLFAFRMVFSKKRFLRFSINYKTIKCCSVRVVSETPVFTDAQTSIRPQRLVNK